MIARESGEGISAAQTHGSEYLSLSGRVDALRTHSKEEMTRGLTRCLEGSDRITRVLLFVIVVSGVVFIALCASPSSVDSRRPLREGDRCRRGLAQGEVTKRVHVNSSDEIGAMGTALNGASTRSPVRSGPSPRTPTVWAPRRRSLRP